MGSLVTSSIVRAKLIAKSRLPLERFHLQKRGLYIGKTKRGKGTKIMLLIDGNGTLCGNMIESASPHEVNLIELLLALRAIRRRPAS